MYLRRPLPEDMAVNFGLRPCALHFGQDYDLMELAKV